MAICTVCGKWKWGSSHRCPPAWEATFPDQCGNDDPWRFPLTIYADYAEDAASQALEDADAGDATKTMHATRVWVRRLGEKEHQAFEAWGEPTVTYSARESEDDRDQPDEEQEDTPNAD